MQQLSRPDGTPSACSSSTTRPTSPSCSRWPCATRAGTCQLAHDRHRRRRRGPRLPARRRRARHDAARHRRPRGAAPAARRRHRRPGALPHRQGRGRGPDRRPHRRRRRLRDQAVQPRGGRRPAARADPPRPGGRAGRGRRRCSSSATSPSTRTATRCTAAGDEITLTATEFELLRFLMRNPRRVLVQGADPRPGLAATTSAARPTSSSSTSPTCARRSTPAASR